jgi:polysaccharide export outer membrane protein
MMPDTSRLIGTLVLGGALLGASVTPAAATPGAQQSSQQPSSSAPAQGAQTGSKTTKPATPPAQPQPAPSTAARPATPAAADTGVQPPADYVIGADDALRIVFWREDALSGEVVVRPDGKISLALLNDVQAAGLTPNQLRESLVQAASRYVTDPSVTVIVKQINSRKVFVTGQVNKPGPFVLNDNMTVLQMLALAGGLQEWADADHILVMRTERGATKSYKFNYKDVRKGKNLQQNILLKPGDTIVVP